MTRLNLVGVVISQGKMSKTVKVRVQHLKLNKIVDKEIAIKKDYLVHDEGEVTKEGDIVRIEQTRPLSKRKRFAIAEIKKNQGEQFSTYNEAARLKVQREETQKAQEFLAKRSRTEENMAKGESVLKDLLLIKDSFTDKEKLSAEESAKAEALKEKYGIQSWNSPENSLKTQIQAMSKQIQDLRYIIDNIKPNLDRLMSSENESVANEILKSLNKDPETIKKHTRKNVLRKFLLTNENAAEYLSRLQPQA